MGFDDSYSGKNELCGDLVLFQMTNNSSLIFARLCRVSAVLQKLLVERKSIEWSVVSEIIN